MNKNKKNVDAVAPKLIPAFTRKTNHKLEIASKERQKREGMM